MDICMNLNAFLSIAFSAFAQISQPVSPYPSFVGDARELIIRRAVGPDARMQLTEHHAVIYAPEVESLVPLACQTLDDLHQDVATFCSSLGMPLPEIKGKHMVLIMKDYETFQAVQPPDLPLGVRNAVGHYDYRSGILYWFDQRTGPQTLCFIRDVTESQEHIALLRREIESSLPTGVPLEFSFGGPMQRLSIEQTEALIRGMEAENTAKLSRLPTPEGGLYPVLFRHEAAHQVLFDHGVMKYPVAGWLIEGSATLFEAFEISGGQARPAIEPTRLNWLRRMLFESGAVDIRIATEPYAPASIRRVLDLREMVHNNFAPQDDPRVGATYYSRYWGFCYYLAKRRPHDLAACLLRTQSTDPERGRDPQSWVKDFEAVFGTDYDGITADFTVFVIELLTEDDRRQTDLSIVFEHGNRLVLGAEIGVSTSRIHAYGPMALEEMTTQRYVVDGQGQVR